MASTNNPPTALMASARPLAPRLTPALSSQPHPQQLHNPRSLLSDHEQRASQHPSTGRTGQLLSGTFTDHTASTSSVETPPTRAAITVRSPRSTSSRRMRSRPLLQRVSQPSSATPTQALNVDSMPSTNRFSAYLPSAARVQTPSIVPLSNQTPRHVSSLDRFRSPSAANAAAEYPSTVSTSFGTKSRLSPNARFEAGDVHPQFRHDADLCGDVLVRCAHVDFYVHKAVLYFSSPFFRAILDGDWKETHPSLHSSMLECSDTGEGTGASSPFSGDEHIDIPSGFEQSLTARESGLADGTRMEKSISDHARSPRASFHTAHLNFEVLQDQFSGDDVPPLPTPDVFPQGPASLPIADLEHCSTPDVASLTADVTGRQSQGKSRHRSISEPLSQSDVNDLAGRLQRMATPPLPDKLSHLDSQACTSSAESSNEDESAEKFQARAPQQDQEATQMTKTDRRCRQCRRRQMRDLVAIVDLNDEDPGTFQEFLYHTYPNLELLVTWFNIYALLDFADKFEVPYLRRACTTFLRASLAGRPIDAMALSERHGIDDVYREASRHVLDNMAAWEPEELSILSNETLLSLERRRTWFLERLLKLALANPARDYECHAACSDPQGCARNLHERWHAQYATTFKYGPPQPSTIWRRLRELEGSGPWGTAMSACQSSSKAWVQSLFDRMYGLPTHGKAPQKFLAIKLHPNDAPRPRQRTAPIAATAGGARSVGNALSPASHEPPTLAAATMLTGPPIAGVTLTALDGPAAAIGGTAPH